MTLATQTVRDIAVENPAAVRVFENYGIDYCCGGKLPLAEACLARNLNVDEVIASLEAATAPIHSATQDWTRESLAALAAHIVGTHHAYVTREVPRLNDLAARVVSRHGNSMRELPEIQLKVTELGEELIEHQGKEEVVLFPYIGKLERYASGGGAKPRSCFGTIANPIAMMTRDHDLAGNLMLEIRKLSQDYKPPEGACPTFHAFYTGLREFEQDLRQHIHLENNILFPRAVTLETSAA